MSPKKHINILVVEEEEALKELIKLKLERAGLTVENVISIQETISFLENNGPPDLIWLDHYLSEKELGLDLVVKLKENDAWKDIPIIVVSNTATLAKIRQYEGLGVSKFYTKADSNLEDIIEDIKSMIS